MAIILQAANDDNTVFIVFWIIIAFIVYVYVIIPLQAKSKRNNYTPPKQTPTPPPKQSTSSPPKQDPPPSQKEERKTYNETRFEPKIDIDNELVQEYLDEFSKRDFEIFDTVDDTTIKSYFGNGSLNECVSEIMKKMGLLENKVELKVYNDEEFPGADKECAAFVSIPANLPLYGSKAFNLLTIPISIKRSYTITYETFVYTIAHELSHIVLHSIKNTLKESEMSTDLFVMIKGFGSLMERGKKVINQSGGTTNLGYLKESTFLFAKGYLRDLKNNKIVFRETWEKYKITQIGSQFWTSGNLNVKCYRNGAPIAEARSKNEWINYCNQGIGCCCQYEYDTNNGTKYGMLYNWYSLIDSRSIAMKGWHIPKKKEFETLIEFLGGREKASRKMKELNNEIRWNGLAGGFCGQNGLFNSIGLYTGWWTFEPSIEGNAWVCGLYHNNNNVNINDYSKGCGFSVRCVKDISIEAEGTVNFVIVKS